MGGSVLRFGANGRLDRTYLTVAGIGISRVELFAVVERCEAKWQQRVDDGSFRRLEQRSKKAEPREGEGREGSGTRLAPILHRATVRVIRVAVPRDTGRGTSDKKSRYEAEPYYAFYGRALPLGSVGRTTLLPKLGETERETEGNRETEVKATEPDPYPTSSKSGEGYNWERYRETAGRGIYLARAHP
ncbi:hypothetical protein KM043_007290 [Ampulex compressa]|nr:hypothetical protein KM043_007290 [Ampulex compressa]